MREFRTYKQKIEEFIEVSDKTKKVKPYRVEAEDIEFDSNAIDEYLAFHPRKKLMKAIM